jgi:Asp-tRNA(Asn)/Glu-tRNA(Gln) amidotransferase A subunit family amidase
MSAARLNFDQWRTLVRQSPEHVVDLFISRLEELSTVERQAWFANTPLKHQLLDALNIAAADETSPLASVPYVLQDLFDVKGLPTGCGAPLSTLFKVPMEHSSRLHQKLQTLGACLFSKTMPAEFGVSPRGLNPTYGDSKHNDGEQFVCGGGAGSTIRTVAEGLTPLGFGLDTGGGIRIPAAFHGLFGFRMSNNLYARDGVFPIAPSIESVGWVNNCIADLCTTFRAFHHLPKSNSNVEPRGYLINELSGPTSPDIKSGLVGLTRGMCIDDDPLIGIDLRSVLTKAGDAYKRLAARELYSTHQYWIEEYSDQYDHRLRRIIESGMECRPFEADESIHVQEEIRSTLSLFFNNYDYLILPISPITTPKKSAWSLPLENDISQLIAPASLAFLPAIILPFECPEGGHSAAQAIINPNKLEIVPELLAQLSGYYENNELQL